MNPSSQPFGLTPENPWPGLQSFTEDGKEFFFGRKEETDALLRLIRRDRITVFYSQSGLGKSSLLCAGLFPKLRPLQLLPVRLRIDYSDETPPPIEQVKLALAEVFRAHQLTVRPPAPDESLWAYFHRRDLEFRDAQHRLVTPVLVFDQFEERFTLGRRDAAADARAEAFLTGLSQLVENRPPPALRAQFDADPDAPLAYDFDKQTCKVVFCLREDFLPELDALRDRFPAVGSNRFRLLPMSTAQALEVVRQPGSSLVSPEVAAAIVEFTAFSRQQHAGGEVEPALLSLVLQELNVRRQQNGEAQISAHLLSGNKDKILEDFFEAAVQELPPQARTFIEDGLLTSSGYRNSIALEDAHTEYGLDDASLAFLVNRHLVRREERLGSTRLELVHDLLTGVIAASRDRRRAAEQQEAELAKVRARQRELEREREDQRRKSRRMVAVCLLLALTSLSMVAYWAYEQYHYHWPYVTYARDHQNRWGVPQEVGPLSEEATHHRAVSLKFVRRGKDGPLLEMQAVDAAGQPTYKNSVGTYLNRSGEQQGRKQACRWEYDYDSEGYVVYEKAYDWQSNLVRGMIYTPAKPGQTFRVAQYVGPDGLPQPQGLSQAEFVRFQYNPAGYELDILYQDRYGQPQAGPDLAYGQRHEYDDGGRLVKNVSLGIDGRPMNDESGNAIQIMEYDSPGDVTNSYALDENRQPCLWRDGYHKFSGTFDSYGNRVSMACFDLAGRPVLNAEGYHASRTAYDERGNWTNEIYLGTNGLPMLNKAGYAAISAQWDARGNRVAWACFDVAGKPAIDQSLGSHLTRTAYDEHGNWTNEVYLGTNGQPVRTSAGYAAISARWDARGNQAEWACFDTNGAPALDPALGCHMTRTAYDERGNWTNLVYLDINGRPGQTLAGYASISAQWDARGNQAEWACFDTNGAPALDAFRGYHLTRTAYDERGNLTSQAYFGTDGQPVLIRDGYASVRTKCDERGNQIERAVFDENGNPARDVSLGCHLTRSAYDERGHLTNQVYLGTNGLPVLTAAGYASVRAKWDARGNETEWACFGLQNEPILDPATGTHGWHKEFAAGTNWTLLAYYNCDGQLTWPNSGFPKTTRKFDAQGHQLEYAVFGADDRPDMNSFGYHLTRCAYDERGNLTNQVYLGTNGLPVLTKSGYAFVRIKYDAQGNQTEWACFGLQNEPVPDLTDGTHRCHKEYAAGTNCTLQAYYDVDGQLTWPAGSYPKITRNYDARGNCTNQAYFGIDGRPVLTKSGYASLRIKYDEQGNQVEWACYGLQNEPVLDLSDGTHMFRKEFTNGTNCTLLAYYDTNDQLAWPSQGYPKVVRKFDAGGRQIEWACYDTDGRPAVNQSLGCHMTRTAYDERGNWTNEVYLGTNGLPVLTTDGYASVQSRWDARGNQIEWSCFGLENEPIVNPATGAHMWRMEYVAGPMDQPAGDSGSHPAEAEPGILHSSTTLGLPEQNKAGTDAKRAKWDERGDQVMRNSSAVFHHGPVQDQAGGTQFSGKEFSAGNASSNYWTVLAYYDCQGQLTWPKGGYPKTTRQFDALGRQTERALFGTNDEPILDLSQGYHLTRAVHDERGNLKSLAYFGTNGLPVLTSAGYASVHTKYDEHGNQTEWACFGLQNEPVLDPSDGTHMCRKEFAAGTNWTRLAYYDCEGQLTRPKDGYPLETRKFDARGNCTNRAYFGTDGLPLLIDAGYASFESQWDLRGNQTEWACFGLHNEPVVDPATGAHMWKKIFGAGTNWTILGYFDCNLKLTWPTNGFPIETQKFDLQGHQIEWACFDTNENPAVDPALGYHRFRSTYDEQGNVISRAYFGTNDLPVLTQAGYALIRAKWDPQGNQTEWSCYGLHDEPVADAARGIHMWRREFGAGTNWTHWAYYDTNDQLTLPNNDYPQETRRFDAEGHCIEQAYWGTNNLPLLTQAGYASIHTKFDDRGNLIEWSCFGLHEEPVVDVARGIHMWRREFGAGTNWTLWAYYDANDQLTWPKNDYPKETRQYDAQGNQTERALFGTHDEPVMDLSHGYHRVSTTYDERGNWTREVYLGTNGLPVLVKGCYAAISAQWDDRSNQTEFAYWGVNGEPVRGPDNFHRRVIEYGADGKILAQKYYDAQGKELNQPSP